jgi:GNAT superfamily N-acetyltransferase
MPLDIQPLTPQRWNDLVDLFARPGASVPRGCYCMFYRRSGSWTLPAGLTRSEANRRELKALVDRGIVPGLIAYEGERAVGWVSLGPREQYARLERSPVMKAVDAKPVWSIVCFFVDAKARGRGLADALLEGALGWARARGVTLVEAYPCERSERGRDDSMWFGSKSMFDRAGFVEVARRKPARPVMRKRLRRAASPRAAKELR